MDAVRRHWPEYLMEAALLGCFLLSACVFAVLLGHPQSPAVAAIPNGDLRRALTGLAMGTTAIGLFYSPWGQRSGAHLNPSVTLTFWRLGKVKGRDAAAYALFQFAGGAAGVMLGSAFLRELLKAPEVNYAVTAPGPPGVAVAWAAEAFISFAMMTMVLHLTNHKALARYTPLFAGSLVALYITFEAPLSGMSMNPARTLGSALPAGAWNALWVYFTAPPVGMLAAAEAYLHLRGPERVACAKLHHQNGHRCIFCGFPGRSRP